MIATIIVLLLVCIYGIQFGKTKAYSGYLAKDRTDSVKGIFILIVFLSHIHNYIRDAGYSFDNIGDKVYLQSISSIGQLMVVMFLFYSGYGVMESIKRKGETYVSAFPKHRLLNTLLNFDIAVCIFLVLNILIGNEIKVGSFLLALTTWVSIGNSNWYIFAILICYATTWLLSLKYVRIRNYNHLVRGVLMTLTIVAVILYFVKESWWYNTLWSYPTGMLYSLNKNKLENYLEKKYLLVLICLVISFALIYMMPLTAVGFRMNSLGVNFSIIIVMITMRIKICNGVLKWCGANLFPLYIYQRVPMMLFAVLLPSWMINQVPLIYVVVCLLSTFVITYFYKYFRLSI